jgi:hypothetical protein
MVTVSTQYYSINIVSLSIKLHKEMAGVFFQQYNEKQKAGHPTGIGCPACLVV